MESGVPPGGKNLPPAGAQKRFVRFSSGLAFFLAAEFRSPARQDAVRFHPGRRSGGGVSGSSSGHRLK